MTLYTAELYTADGNHLDRNSAEASSRLTPERMLQRSLESRLPGIFQFDMQQDLEQGGSVLSCVGLTLPLIAADKLQACASLIWRVEEDFTAALEVWRPDASGVLRLGDSFYGPQQAFERVSRGMSFRVLEGLPGLTFDAHRPVIFETLSKMRGFLRAEAASAARLSVGLGIPVLDKGMATCAVLLLGSARTPLARRFEVWLPDELGVRLGSSRSHEPEHHDARPPCPALATAVIKARMPQLGRCRDKLRVGLPIFGGKTVRSVVVLEV